MSRFFSTLAYFIICCISAIAPYELTFALSNIPHLSKTKKIYHYLALGDSYTIGEAVAPQDNFHNKVAYMFQHSSVNLETRIIARTGWTTDELEAGIEAAQQEEPLRLSYDFVSLLIGVNNQYRGRTVENYKKEFEALLKKAIRFAGNKTDRVVVLSIPDWGVTPFAENRNRTQIATEIDAYNIASKEIAFYYKVSYIDITPWTREAASDSSLLTTDGLHPSAKLYKRLALKFSFYFLH